MNYRQSFRNNASHLSQGRRKLFLAFILLTYFVSATLTSTAAIQGIFIAGRTFSLRHEIRLYQDSLRMLKPMLGNLTQPISEDLAKLEKELSLREVGIYELMQLVAASFISLFLSVFFSLLFIAKAESLAGWDRLSWLLTSVSRWVILIGIPIATTQLAGCFFFLGSANTFRLASLTAYSNLLHPLSTDEIEGISFLAKLTMQLYSQSIERAISLAMILILLLIAIAMAIFITLSKKRHLAIVALSIVMILSLFASFFGFAVVIWQLFT